MAGAKSEALARHITIFLALLSHIITTKSAGENVPIVEELSSQQSAIFCVRAVRAVDTIKKIYFFLCAVSLSQV